MSTITTTQIYYKNGKIKMKTASHTLITVQKHTQANNIEIPKHVYEIKSQASKMSQKYKKNNKNKTVKYFLFVVKHVCVENKKKIIKFLGRKENSKRNCFKSKNKTYMYC